MKGSAVVLPVIVLVSLLVILAGKSGLLQFGGDWIAVAATGTQPPLLAQFDDQATLLGNGARRLYVTNNDLGTAQLLSVGRARHGTTTLQDNAVLYTPARGYTGADSFTYTARNPAGKRYRARVRLQIERATPTDLLLARMAWQPETAAQIRHAPTNNTQRTAWEQTLDNMRANPWLARGFETVERAIAAKAPVDLYVFLGDELLQGVTQGDNFSDAGSTFPTELDRIWDNTPDQSNGNTILTLNCARAGTSIVQWSNLYSPLENLPAWAQEQGGANLSADCLFFLDLMLQDPSVPVALRGIVVGFGTTDVRLARQLPSLRGAWRSHLRQLLDLYRGSYGSDIAVLLVPPLKVAANSGFLAEWQRFNRILRNVRTHNVAVVESRDLPQWQHNGQPLLTAAGQRALGRRLAKAAHERWMAEWLYTPAESKPALGAVGECSRQTPCFPGTHYQIIPSICEQRDFFRPGGKTRLLCDQHGNSLHALASGCNHCIDLNQVAGTLGVGLVKSKTGARFRPAPYMRQSVNGKRILPLPYQNPYVVGAPRPCGYFDRESTTFLLSPGSHRFRVDSRISENCTSSNRAACGLLMSPTSARRELFQRTVDVSAGTCTEVLVQRPGGDILTCGQQIERDTVLGADMHCPERLMDGLWIVEDGVTLDLNGYTIFGKPSPDFERYGPSTAIKVHADNVTVTNGVIEGWDGGIGGVYSDNGTEFHASNLTIRSLDVVDHEHQLSGIGLQHSRSATINSVLFEFLSKFHSDSIMLGDTDAVARNIRQFGGSSAFAIGPYECDHDREPINVEFSGSVIRDAYLSSFFAQCINSARVHNNEFAWTGNIVSDLGGAPAGFSAHAGLPRSVKDVEFRANFIRGAAVGLSFDGATNSRAIENVIIDSGWRGIELGHSLLCAHLDSPGSHPLPDWFECFGASGNTVENNWVTSKWSSLTDLYENARAHDNNWRGNICETTGGQSIPPCLPEP